MNGWMDDRVAGRLHSHDMKEQENLFEHIKGLLSIRWIVGWTAGCLLQFRFCFEHMDVDDGVGFDGLTHSSTGASWIALQTNVGLPKYERCLFCACSI
jgi:hypothetical protein